MNKLVVLGMVLTASLGVACDKGKAKEKAAPAPTAPTAPTGATPGSAAPTPTAPATPTTPAAPAGTPAAADGLRLPLATRAVGHKWTRTDDMTSNMEIVAGDKKITIVGKRHFRDQHEVLEVVDGIMTKAKVTYLEREEQEDAGGKTKTKPHPVAGKSYIVWSKDGKVEATLADGGAVSPEELAELTSDLDELGRPQVMDKIMAGRTWKVGETYTLSAAELDELRKVKGEGKPTPAAYGFTLREVVDGQARFAMTSALDTEAKAKMHVELSGTATIDVATGRPVSLVLSGPVQGTVNGMSVTGTMTGTVTYVHEAP